MGDFTIYNVSGHFTAERLSAREQDIVADICEAANEEQEVRVLAEAKS
ncbi:hypothetical protein [Amycolatopsis sp. CA-230715]|nr:hypothetical protein [Amycolatopsis sp. CA-230715]QWF78912.1 hypothetical protein HUW46_02311 [Amycolatopsis sp. CA-230715]